ncbi:hypothetical protein LWI28_005663 [Acer negundo]|uniref:Uncharacterized protein n=1 Tax=Acer negundo TaxID=4023 RepID=A0AAD5JDE3_ACENE|nr:hypothetical protein LWI28_005663 [Acer negundo]
MSNRGDRMEKVDSEEWVHVRGKKDGRKLSKTADTLSPSMHRHDSLQGGMKLKGKQSLVRTSNKKPTDGIYREGKLYLEKRKDCHVRGVGSITLTSDLESAFVEGRGECSKWRQVTRESVSNRQGGLEKGTSGRGPQWSFEAYSETSEKGTELWGVSPTVTGTEVGNLNKILVRYIDQTIGPISDQEGRDINLPLKDPISFPLLNLQGGHVTAEELISVPLLVELGEERKKGNHKQQKWKKRWSLQEEIAKVIEKGFSLGYEFKVRGKKAEGGYLATGNSVQERSWSMGIENANMIEVGVALVVDFNGQEHSIWIAIAQREVEDENRLAETNGLLMEGFKSAAVIKQSFTPVVGCGNMLQLWSDFLVDGRLLKIAFSRCYALAVSKSGEVQNFGSWLGDNWVWNVKTRKPCFDWEMEQWRCFNTFLNCLPNSRHLEDSMAWSFNSNGCFTVSSFTKKLEDTSSAWDSVPIFLWKGICPPKIEIFL